MMFQAKWMQTGQSLGPENDCSTCFIEIDQNGEAIAVNSNTGWYADMVFDNEKNDFLGTLTWGNISPDDGPQNAVLFWDEESSELVIQTFIQGAEYNLYFQQ